MSGQGATRRERADFRQHWHERVNRFHDGLREAIPPPAELPHEHWMYEAMHAHEESQRLQRLFAREREGKLPAVHVQCATVGTPPVEVPDNHLTCCLGVECRKCPFLLGLEGGGDRALTPEQLDEAKAWTCVAHILSKGGDPAGEGYILTTDDRMYWDATYASLAAGMEADEP